MTSSDSQQNPHISRGAQEVKWERSRTENFVSEGYQNVQISCSSSFRLHHPEGKASSLPCRMLNTVTVDASLS
jgi:hypothetical protein